MGHAEPASDRLVGQIARRTLSSSELERKLALRVELTAPLPGDLRSELSAEALECSARRGPGLLVPREVRVEPGGAAVELLLDPFDARAIRLDTLLASLAAAGSAFGSPLAALLAGATAARLRALHVEQRAHGDLGPRHVLVGPGGGVALIGPGLPLIRALMVPGEAKAARARRRAPEVLLGADPTPRADVHGLGALYYELLAGVPYRETAGIAALRGAARANLPPELPGSLPDPRPSLLAFLRRCLGREADRPADARAFLSGLEKELSASGLALADRGTLAALLEEYVPDGAVRGADVLVDDGALPAAERTMVTESPFRDAAAESSDWAAILGESTEPPATIDTGGEASPASEPQASGPTPAPRLGALPPPADPAPVASGPGRLALPSADATPSAASSPAPTPLQAALQSQVGSGGQLSGLAAPTPKRPPPTLDEATKLDRKTLLTVAGACLLLAGLVIGVGLLRGEPEPDPAAETDRSLIPAAGPDAGPAPARAATPPPAPTDRRRPAKPEETPQPKPLGLVSIMSKPSGATVLIDGGYVGTTPLVLKHPLEQRKLYDVNISADGYHDWQESLRPKKGSLSVVAELEPR